MNAGEFAKRRARLEHETGRRKGYQRKALQALVREAGAAIIIVHGKAVAWRMRNGQVVCRKRRFEDEGQAASALLNLVHHPDLRIPRRSYHCEHCGGWHLTSMERSY